MPDITFNNEQVEAKTGEKLLSVARRNALHIGFVCDGRGLCKTCTTHVLSGSEHLGEPTEVELGALPKPLRDQGYRLACQTTVSGAGSVEVISRAEELRRKAIGAATFGAAATTPADNFISFAGNFGQLALDYVSSLPYIFSNIIPRFKQMPLKMNKVQSVLQDAGRVAQRVITKKASPAHQETETE